MRSVKKKTKTRKFSPAETARWNSASEMMKEQETCGAARPGSGELRNDLLKIKKCFLATQNCALGKVAS